MPTGPQLGSGGAKGTLAPFSSGDLQALAVTQLFERGFEPPTPVRPSAQVTLAKDWSDPPAPSALQSKSPLVTDDDWDFLDDLSLDDKLWRSSVSEAFAV